jgi:hypothetical protein
MLFPPILIIIYNRAEKTARLVQALNALRPCKLYICADGPKNRADLEKVTSTRREVENLSSKHHVSRLFSDVNLGCGLNCTRALQWFFAHEPEGVILEDDIEFDSAFVENAILMLDFYRDSKEVLIISGSPYLDLPSTKPYL